MAAIKPQVDVEPRLAPRRPEAEQRLDADLGVLKVLAVIDGSERTGRVLDYLRGLVVRGATLETVLRCSTCSRNLKTGDCAGMVHSRDR
jgi:hypothetical protein